MESNSSKRKHKKKNHIAKEESVKNDNEEIIMDCNTPDDEKKLKKKKLNDKLSKATLLNSESSTTESKNSDVIVKNEESIRAKKKRKHMKLLEEKKTRGEIDLQQKCLNYISSWKYNKPQWRFEKLKQIWLQQNMFDNTKVPDDVWDTLIEYFGSGKGQVKSSVLSEAMKIVEETQKINEDGLESTDIKYTRAREIIQNLNE